MKPDADENWVWMLWKEIGGSYWIGEWNVPDPQDPPHRIPMRHPMKSDIGLVKSPGGPMLQTAMQPSLWWDAGLDTPLVRQPTMAISALAFWARLEPAFARIAEAKAKGLPPPPPITTSAGDADVAAAAAQAAAQRAMDEKIRGGPRLVTP